MNAAWAPNLHANGGLLRRDLRMPDFRGCAVAVPKPGAVEAEATRVQGQLLRDVLKLKPTNFRIFGPDETASNLGSSRPSAPGATRKVFSTGLPSASFGPVQPFGVRSTIIGHRGRCMKPLVRASPWTRLTSADHGVQRRRHELVHLRGVIPFDEMRCVPATDEQRFQLVMRHAPEHRGPDNLISAQVQNGQYRPSRTGSRNLFEGSATATRRLGRSHASNE